MSTPRSDYSLFVGVDISAASFMAAWRARGREPSTPRSFPQSPAGFQAFQEQLHAICPSPADILIVLEATGSYWIALAVALHQAGYHVNVANPAKVHDWAKSLSRRGKTDALDTTMLTQYALERHPEPWTPPPAVYHELRQRLLARDGLLEMRQQARNQLHALEQWPIQVAAAQQRLREVVAMLDGQVKSLDAELEEVMADGAWAASAAHLLSVPGLGLMTTAWLLVGTVNFSICASAEGAANYAGLAPLERQSGTSVRGRAYIGHGGNSRVRKALYMATLSAARYNPVIERFYRRLKERGKPEKVARCAAARKLMHVAFAVVTKGQDFAPSGQKQPAPGVVEPAIAS